MQSYEAARNLFSFLAFCAWTVIIVGGLAALLGASAANEMSSFRGGPSGLAVFTGLVPGLALSFLGFLLLAMVQIGRAGVDTAECTQQMLKVSRDQLEVSQQALRGGGAAPTTFAANAGSKVPAQDNAATFTKSSPKEDHTPRTIYYRERQIRVTNGKFLYNGIPFDSQEKAENYINNLGTPKLEHASGSQKS